MLLLVLLIPLWIFIIIFIWGSRLNFIALKFMVVIAYTCANIIAGILYIYHGNGVLTEEIILIPWISVGPINIVYGIVITKHISIMLLLVISISTLVHLFSLYYMEEEPHINRFISYLSLFTLFMIILITAPNLIQLFIGWEGVGLCSFLLISFWYTRQNAVKSAYKAMALNKIGDISFIIAAGILFKEYGTFNINLINALASEKPTFIYACSGESCYMMVNASIHVASIFFMVAIFSKSAQFILHSWLPDAMEGPTPVSALIHAATMVTAGVFLIHRLSPMFSLLPMTGHVLVFMGAFTCLISALIGLLQNDLKKIIAYSTCSQLGYMVMISGLGFYEVSLIHVIFHGYFKALLFLSAGYIIYKLGNEQNIYKMGFTLRGKIYNPIAYMGLLIGSFALCGVPFFTGYYSKDLLLESIASNHPYYFVIVFSFVAANLTICYSLKILFSVFWGSNKFYAKTISSQHTVPKYLILVIFILVLQSIFIGFLVYSNTLTPVEPCMTTFNPSKALMYIGMVCVAAYIYLQRNKRKHMVNYFEGWGLATGLTEWIWYPFSLSNKPWKGYWYRNFKNFLRGATHFDILVIYSSKRFFKFLGFNITYKLIDSQLLEYFGPTGISYLVKIKSRSVWVFNKGFLPAILFTIIFWVVFILFTIM